MLDQNHLVFHQASFDPSWFFGDKVHAPVPYFATDHGALFQSDCLKILRQLEDDVIDTIFADPPFNLKKQYGNSFDDDLSTEEYLDWCYEWIDECVRILKPGGAIFIYNIPK